MKRQKSRTHYITLFCIACGAALIMIYAATSARLQSCVPPPTGMVGWWPGDGNADDISGYGNNGTLQNGATATATGKVAQTFHFDGNGQFVETSNSGALMFERSEPFSMDAWVRTSTTARNLFITAKEQNSGDFI